MPIQKPQKPKPKRPSAKKKGSELVHMSVPQPEKMPTAFKEMAVVESTLQNSTVRVWRLYDEAVREFLANLQTGERVFFSPNPIHGTSRTSILLSAETMDALRATGDRLNIQYTHLVFTALIQYLAKRGQIFEGFPSSYGG
jgi:hypothetical protein